MARDFIFLRMTGGKEFVLIDNVTGSIVVLLSWEPTEVEKLK